MKIHTIVTHKFPHADEAWGIGLLWRFGHRKYPGVRNAKLAFWDVGAATPDGRPAEAWEKEGYLLVGVGGGRFDERAGAAKERKRGSCAATLVAEDLGLANLPEHQQILEFLTRVDNTATAHPFDISAIAKDLNFVYPDNPSIVVKWVMDGLWAKFLRNKSFWNETRREFRRLAKIERIEGPEGKSLTVVTVETDLPDMAKFARSSHGASAAIVILRQSPGHTQILVDQRRKEIRMQEVVRMLRIEEQRARGSVVTTDSRTLEQEGTVPGCEEWYFQPEGQLVLNGSLTNRGVSPTKIPLDRIMEIVRLGVSPHASPEEKIA